MSQLPKVAKVSAVRPSALTVSHLFANVDELKESRIFLKLFKIKTRVEYLRVEVVCVNLPAFAHLWTF
jgi:hypothetical protein